jgi:hypothetical protein
MLRPLMVMSVGFWILFVYILMVRTQMYYLTHLLLAKKGRLLSHAHLSDLPT